MSSWTEKGSRPVSEIKFFIKEWYSPPVNWFSGTIFTFMRANFKMKIACHTFMPKTCTELIEMSLRCLKMHNQIDLYNNPHILVCFVTYKLCQLLLHSFITSHKQQILGANTSKWRRPNLAQYCLGLHNGNGPCDFKMYTQQISTVFHFSNWRYTGQLLRQRCQATPTKMATSVKQFCQYWAFYH